MAEDCLTPSKPALIEKLAVAHILKILSSFPGLLDFKTKSHKIILLDHILRHQKPINTLTLTYRNINFHNTLSFTITSLKRSLQFKFSE
jgi:hypothetical protein